MVTIYILALEENKYYVGKWKPANVAMRIQQHFDGNGAKWTKKFRPKRVCSIHHNRDDREETRLTIEMMKIHGIPNVRGGSLSRVRLTKKDREYAKWKCGLTTKRPPATDRFARPGEASKKRRRKRRGNGACRTRKRYERIAKYGQCQARTKIAGGRQCRAPCEKGETTCSSTGINVWGYGLRKSKVARKEESTDDMAKELHSMANVVVLSKVVDSAGYLVKRGTTPVIPIGVNVWSDRIFL